MGRVAKMTIGLWLGVLVALMLAAPAFAHGDYESSIPAKGERLKKKPQHIAIVLTEAPVKSSTITVFDGCGKDVTQATYVDDRTIHAVPDEDAGRGRWRVQYSIVSAEDGHQTDGSFGFRVKGRCTEDSDEPDEGDGSGEAGDDDGVAIDGGPALDIDSGFPTIPVLGVAAAALVGIAMLVRRGGT